MLGGGALARNGEPMRNRCGTGPAGAGLAPPLTCEGRRDVDKQQELDTPAALTCDDAPRTPADLRF